MRLFRISGSSMNPTLWSGDVVLASPASDGRQLAVGDVVVLRMGAGPGGGNFSVKRIASLAGQHFRTDAGDGVIPPGFVAVLGDNLEVSLDSRKFGFVPLSALVGRARLRLTKTGPRRLPPFVPSISSRITADDDGARRS